MKERIIGAVVLVVVVVLVVPIFLDGPPEDGEVVSERVLLPGQDGQKTQTVVLERDRAEPVPAASTPREEPAAAQEEPEAEEPEVEVIQRNEPSRVPPKDAPKPVPQKVEDEPVSPPPEETGTSATGMWAVQLGSFSNVDNANNLAAKLRREGYAAFVREHKTASGTQHRVRVGPLKDRASAEAMAARLAKAGHEGKVMPNP